MPLMEQTCPLQGDGIRLRTFRLIRYAKRLAIEIRVKGSGNKPPSIAGRPTGNFLMRNSGYYSPYTPHPDDGLEL